MKVTFSVNADCVVETEVKDAKGAFAFIAHAQQLFGVKRCGNCESDQLRLMHRQPKGYDYYSVQCDECKHELKFGQQMETGRLFPKGWEPPYEGGGSQRDDREPAHIGAASDDFGF